MSSKTLNKMEPIEEIILDDSDSETVQKIDNEENKEKDEGGAKEVDKERDKEVNKEEDKIEIPSENSHDQVENLNPNDKGKVDLRGLLPQTWDKNFNSPTMRRCYTEHNYFQKKETGIFRYNLRGKKSNTLPFQNKNSDEHPTIDVECLAAKLNAKLNSVYVSDCLSKNNVNRRSKRNSVSSSSCSGSSSVADANDIDYFPEDNTTDSDSNTAESINSRCSVKKKYSDDNQKNNKLAQKNTNVSCIPSEFYNVDVNVKDMQKLLKARCLSDKTKSGKIPPPRLRKMLNQRKSENILKMSDYVFPMPNLTKVTNEEKNWRVEYMDDEVQNLGLDDLLLKASELNAENFTKALGRKLEPMKTNFSSKDSSEIVFTIPKSTKIVENGCETDADRKSLKGIKLDISKPFFEAEKNNETNSVKTSEDVSPKKPGIKVKTVENINEEFKDSLGRLNGVNKDLMPTLDKNNFSLSLNEREFDKKPQEITEKDSEGSRPFIMTIIQSKSEKQRPAILRNSYLKKKGSLEKKIQRQKISEKSVDCRIEDELSSGANLPESEKSQESTDCISNSSTDKRINRSMCGEGFMVYPKVFDEQDNSKPLGEEERFAVKKRNIPFILNHNRKVRQTENGKTTSNIVKVNEVSEKLQPCEKSFKITSVEQKLGAKEMNRRFIKVVPYEPVNKHEQTTKHLETQQQLSDEESENLQKEEKASQVLSLGAFSNILKEILPEKWFLCLDKKHGLQIIKTHLDECLNPSILISVVIARCGKLTVNVRGKQLKKSHELFANLGHVTNSENKLSLNYVLSVLNKLRHRSVCFGCDDPSLKKYWSNDGLIENQTEFQQVYRSHLCQLLVSLGKRRCYPCYRMNESLKKRFRREKLGEKVREEKEKDSKDVAEDLQQSDTTPKTRGVKRNLEDFLEESFSTMKQQIVDEIEKNRRLGEREDALKAQEEVLSFMGLTRKESLDNPVRKSKRNKNSFYKLAQPAKKKTDQKELEFLEKYWTDINTLFSTSLLFGAYSRTGRSRLREKCRMFQKLLSTWKNIVATNPEWIGEISLPNELTEKDEFLEKDPSSDQFEKMDVQALRSYIINSVKEVNRIKHKLRTRNSYFKLLYNKFVKRRMKRPKTLGESKESSGGNGYTPTPTDFSSDENSREKEKTGSEERKDSCDGTKNGGAD